MPMVVKTTLKETIKKGIALIAGEFIEKGQLVYYDDSNIDRIIPSDIVEKAHPVLKEFITTYASYNQHTKTYYLCLDNARFFNHSNFPNTKYHKRSGIVRALKAVKIGEELTSDYGEFDDFSKAGDFGFEIFEN